MQTHLVPAHARNPIAKEEEMNFDLDNSYLEDGHVLEFLPFAADTRGNIHRAIDPEGNMAFVVTPFTEEQQEQAQFTQLCESQWDERNSHDGNQASKDHNQTSQLQRGRRHRSVRGWLAALYSKRKPNLNS